MQLCVPGNSGEGWALSDASNSDQLSTSGLVNCESRCRNKRVSSPAATAKHIREQLVEPALLSRGSPSYTFQHRLTRSHVPPSRLRDSLLLAERMKRGAGRSIMELAWRVWAWVRPLYRNFEPKTRKRRDEGGSTVGTLGDKKQWVQLTSFNGDTREPGVQANHITLRFGVS